MIRLFKKQAPRPEPIAEIAVLVQHEVKSNETETIAAMHDCLQDLQVKINATKSFRLPLRSQREISSALCYLREKLDALETGINKS